MSNTYLPSTSHEKLIRLGKVVLSLSGKVYLKLMYYEQVNEPHEGNREQR